MYQSVSPALIARFKGNFVLNSLKLFDRIFNFKQHSYVLQHFFMIIRARGERKVRHSECVHRVTSGHPPAARAANEHRARR